MQPKNIYFKKTRTCHKKAHMFKKQKRAKESPIQTHSTCSVTLPPRVLCPWNFPGKNTGVGLPFPPPGVLPDPGIEPMSPVSLALQACFLPQRQRGKPFRHMEDHLNTPLMLERSSMGKNDRKTAILEKNFIEMRNKKVLKLKIVSKYQE